MHIKNRAGAETSQKECEARCTPRYKKETRTKADHGHGQNDVGEYSFRVADRRWDAKPDGQPERYDEEICEGKVKEVKVERRRKA